MKIFLIGSFLLLTLNTWSQSLPKNPENRKELIQEAENIRQEGHKYFNKKKYDSALYKYNVALILFKLQSDSTSIA
ncbi:hypothetical protein MNBD_BACTEROID06-897, partial [hydrothermal vent metagenome]